MDKTMQHFNQYQQDSSFDWQGLRSNRFPKSRLMLPHPDLIHSGNTFIIKVSTSRTAQWLQAGITSMVNQPLNSTLSDPDWDNLATCNTGTQDPATNEYNIWNFHKNCQDVNARTIKSPSTSTMTDQLVSGHSTIITSADNTRWKTECKEKLE